MTLVLNTSCNNQVQIYESIQGEGMDSGLPAFFVRLQGCNVHCFFCDEKDTWILRDNNSVELEAPQILDTLEKLNPELKRVIITGGEPTEQNISPLIRLLLANDFQVSVETAATGNYVDELLADYGGRFSITFSPKDLYSKNSYTADKRIWAKCSEIKFVVASPEASNYLLNTIIPNLAQSNNQCPIFLVPDWYNLEPNKKLVIELLKKYPNRFRMGFQLHKIVDMP
ncbi:MAG: 7-carboxy-7-deazaguanine synthase QueE [Candidatus Caenarcaniphilales bacterium]|jgi:organic radical activating enzyme|nr:7-carboxy-7-deazaguanine synthase QueE [Candidatus Caenarcaniphilales bacterium]